MFKYFKLITSAHRDVYAKNILIKRCYCAGTYNDLKQWLENLKSQGHVIPSNVTEEHFMELLKLPNSRARYSFLYYLYKLEIDERAQRFLKSYRTYKIMERNIKRQEQAGHINYKLWHNCLYIKRIPKCLRYERAYDVMNEQRFRSPIVFDCSLTHHMSAEEQRVCVQELLLAVRLIMDHNDPFQINLCNVDHNERFAEILQRYFDRHRGLELVTQITKNKCTELFPKEKLVHLSPDATEVLTHIDQDKVYVISALVDFELQKNRSYNFAAEEGIRAVKLPVNDALSKKLKRSDLDISCVVSCLLNLQTAEDVNDVMKNNMKRKKKAKLISFVKTVRENL